MTISMAMLMVAGCATVTQESVKVMEEIPKVSNTLRADTTKRTLKRTVAIARFSNETKYGQGFLVDENNDRIGKQSMDILSSKMAATGKFILLERADMDKIDKELARGGLAGLNIASDYLIVGSVSEFGRKDVSDVGVFSRVKKQVAQAKVNIRLIEVKTGQIIYSEEGEGEAFSEAGTVMGVGAKAGYDSSLNDKAIDAAISKMVNNIVENLMGKPWRAYLLAYEDGHYVMSGGQSQGIRQGDSFMVIEKGKMVKNPQSNMMVELPGNEIGTIRVEKMVGNDPDSEVSICSLVSGNIPTSGFENIYVHEKDIR